MKVDKTSIRKAYEDGEGTFKKLSEIYEVSQGTIKSWAKQDRDSNDPWIKPNSNPTTKNQAKKVEKKVEVEEEVLWISIENKYVTDLKRKPCTYEDLSKESGISLSRVEKYAREHSWTKKRENYAKKVLDKTLEKTSDKVSDEFSTINASLIATLAMAATKSQKVIEEELTLTTVADENGNPQVLDFKIINSKKMKEVMDSIRIIQEGIFKGFGKDKEIELEKLKIAQEKLALDKMKVSGDDGEVGDDGFIDALEGKIEDIWNDIDEE